MNSNGVSFCNSSCSDISLVNGDINCGNGDISDVTCDPSDDINGNVYFEETRMRNKKRQKTLSRRLSATSVSTNPEEEAYVMVLQNRCGLSDEQISMFSSSDKYDVTFIVGIEEKQPVHAIREVLATRGRLLYQHVLTYEENSKTLKNAKRSSLKRTIDKLNKLSCVKPDGDVMRKLIIPMETFDPDSFQRLITYIHSGTLTVDASTVVGLLNAGSMFGFPELQKACWDFALGCVVRADNLQDMLSSVRRYSEHKITQKLMSTMHQYAHDYKDLFSHTQTLREMAHELLHERQKQEAVVT